jgi:hypothetical protein
LRGAGGGTARCGWLVDGWRMMVDDVLELGGLTV